MNDEIAVDIDGSNFFSGVVSIIIYFGLFAYFIMRINRVISYRENEFKWRDVFYSPEEMAEQGMTLEKYDNSLNFM